MDKALSVVQALLPLIAFYPRWTQLLFLGTFLMFLGSVLAFVLSYSAASELKRKADASRELPTAVREGIERDLNSVATLGADVGLSLSNYYSSAVATRGHLLDHTTKHPNVQSYMAAPLDGQLRTDVEDTIRKIEAIQASLAAIQRNAFAAACWRRAAGAPSVSGLRSVRKELLSRGFSEAEATIDVGDIPNLTQFFSVAANRLRALSFAPLLSAVLATNSADIKGVGLSYDHAALRTLIFSGNLIFVLVAPSKADPRRHFVASWGTAMLLDIFRVLPTTAIVRAELLARYPMHAQAIEGMSLAIDSNSLVGSDFRFAIEELEKRLALLFLELPAKD